MARTLIYGDRSNFMVPSVVSSTDTNLSHHQSSPLLKISTVFPFVLFPDDLIIEEEKLIIIRRTFFASEEIHTIPIKDVMDIIVSHNVFFATLYVKRTFQNDLYQLNYLKRHEAMAARQLIQELALKLAEKKK